MGAWGPGNFENDRALDFQHEVENADGPNVILQLIGRIAELPDDDDLDADSACDLLVAAEYIAAGVGKPGPHFMRDATEEELAADPREVAGYRDNANLLPWPWRPTPKDVARCVVAVRRVATDSELAYLSEDDDAWAEVIEDLLIRLGEPGI